ncbi:hypothetical protein ADQ89_12715 [Salmonella enterica subsp. enterica]|nr:hypothetical protein [Salmonella enterica subsp. enterica]EEE2764267.1 hypothetical protein [Salmonella enterica subsp. diarizonae]
MMKKVVLFLAIVSFSSVAGITDITTKPVALIALKKTVLNMLMFVKRPMIPVKKGLLSGKKKMRMASFI